MGWTATGNSSFFGSAWVADCGLYIGPWSNGDLTGLPPALVPDGFAELDYYAFAPDGGDLNTLAPRDDQYLFGFLDPGGNGDAGLEGSVTRPAGAHFYVVAYQAGFVEPTIPPQRTPLGMAPAKWVTNGRGPYRDGAEYSGSIANSTSIQALSGDSRNPAIKTSGDFGGDYFFPDTTTTAADLETQLDVARASTAVLSGASIDRLFSGKTANGTLIPSITFGYAVNVSFGQEVLSLVTSPPPPEYDIDYFDDHHLVEGVDYAPSPYTGELANYDDDGGLAHWNTFTARVHIEISIRDVAEKQTLIDNEPVDHSDLTGWPDTAITWRWVPGFIPQHTFPTLPTWFDYLAGEEIAAFTWPNTSLTHFPIDEGGGRIGGGFGLVWLDLPIEMDLSGITDTEITLFRQTQLQDPASTNHFPDYLVYPLQFIPDNTEDNRAQEALVFCNTNWNTLFPDTHVSATWQQPSWRYWKPGTLIIPPDIQLGPRLNQRDDGLGIAGSPRLIGNGAPSSPTSAAASAAPRVPGPNTY